MKSTFFAIALATGAVATPIGQLEARKLAPCITDVEAQRFMGRFTSILQHTNSDLGDYVTTATGLLTEDFQEISDSINMLAGKPLGGNTADKAAYIAGAQHAPPTTGIESVRVKPFDCKEILWEWKISGVGKATYPVKGFGVFKVGRTGKKSMIQASELKLEFNNIAWGLDTGYGWVKQDGTLLGRAPNPAPATTTPTTPAAAPVTEEAPAQEASSTEAPVSESPKTETPVTETPTNTEPTNTETAPVRK